MRYHCSFNGDSHFDVGVIFEPTGIESLTMSESEFIVDVNQESFSSTVVEASMKVPVLLDFWADWCAPCKALMPILTKLAEEYAGGFILAKVNADEQPAITQHLQVQSLPTVKLLKDGQIVDEFNGALPESQVREFLSRHIESTAATEISQVFELINRGDLEMAQSVLQAIATQSPDLPEIPLAQLKITFASGNYDQFDELVAALPAEVKDSPEVAQMQATVDLARADTSGTSLESLQAVVESGEPDSETLYNYAMKLVQSGDYETGLEQLLVLMQKDPGYNEGAARQGLLSVFEMLGSHPLVTKYRRKMFTLLH